MTPEAPDPEHRASDPSTVVGSELRSLRTSRRGLGIGLRAQIGLASLTTIALSVVLVGLATDRLASRAFERERRHEAALVARAVASSLERHDAPRFVLDRLEETLLDRDDVIGFEITTEDGTSRSRGLAGEGVVGEAELDGTRVRVFVTDPSELGTRSLSGLVILYAVVSALAILALLYVLLTHLIVRPIERLERAAERLARGERSSVRVDGAREVAALARSFNDLGEHLRAERTAREARLRDLERALADREAALVALEAAKASLEATQSSLVRSEKLASVGRLAAGVAHEIGNPLSAILGLVELLREGGLSPKDEADFLARVQAETARIHRIIRDLLGFARAPREPERGEPTIVRDAIEAAVGLVSPQKDLRGIRIERHVEEGLPPVALDEDRLIQLLVNLLLNAADAIEAKRARTSAESEEIVRIEATRETSPAGDALILLRITDSGIGFDEATRAALFEPFFTTKPVGRGTGLGLAVCQTIVEDAGGSIQASSVHGGGASFELRLPSAAGG